MRQGSGRICRYCKGPIPDGEPPQARYCRRSHRQRAYEARQARQGAVLRRRLKALKRQVSSYEDCLLELSRDPQYTGEVRAAFLAAFLPLRDEPDDLKRFDRCTTLSRPNP